MADVKEESKRYPLLEFEYDKGPYEKTLELSNQPGFVSYTSGNPDNYMHEGFGFSRGDDKKVLEHAVYLLKKKKSKRATLSLRLNSGSCAMISGIIAIVSNMRTEKKQCSKI